MTEKYRFPKQKKYCIYIILKIDYLNIKISVPLNNELG